MLVGNTENIGIYIQRVLKKNDNFIPLLSQKTPIVPFKVKEICEWAICPASLLSFMIPIFQSKNLMEGIEDFFWVGSYIVLRFLQCLLQLVYNSFGYLDISTAQSGYQ